MLEDMECSLLTTCYKAMCVFDSAMHVTDTEIQSDAGVVMRGVFHSSWVVQQAGAQLYFSSSREDEHGACGHNRLNNQLFKVT